MISYCLTSSVYLIASSGSINLISKFVYESQGGEWIVDKDQAYYAGIGFIWDEEERQSVYLEKKNWKTPPI